MSITIGWRVVEACGIVHRLGGCTTGQVGEWMAGVEQSNVDRYCSRAVGLGLMTVDRTVYPKQYRMASAWQHVLAGLQQVRQHERPHWPAEALAVQPAPLAQRHVLDQVWSRFGSVLS